MLWRKADWPSLLALQSDLPPTKISTLRLADVVLQDLAEAEWMLNEAVRQLDGLREYLLIITDRDYPMINLQVTAETACRALYLRAQLGAAMTALMAHGAMRSELRDELKRRIGTGPEDWVPLRAMDALASVRTREL